jgi:hypothetical protein
MIIWALKVESCEKLLQFSISEDSKGRQIERKFKFHRSLNRFDYVLVVVVLRISMDLVCCKFAKPIGRDKNPF